MTRIRLTDRILSVCETYEYVLHIIEGAKFIILTESEFLHGEITASEREVKTPICINVNHIISIHP